MSMMAAECLLVGSFEESWLSTVIPAAVVPSGAPQKQE
jgi:hypothetical protein